MKDIWEYFDISKKPLYDNPALIRRLYVNRQMKERDIANLINCSQSTVRNRVSKFDLSRPWRNEDVLRELYCNKGFSIPKTADVMGVSSSSVQDYIDKFDISTRKANQHQKYASLYSRTDGHEEWKTRDKEVGGEVCMFVHRLLAISEYGIEEVKNMHVHHKNDIPWDNRIENIQLMSPSDHSKHHIDKKINHGNSPWLGRNSNA